MSAINRKDGFYKVKYNGEWVSAKWVTNQDIDSSWSCWWIEGIEPKAWGWCDEDFEDIVESSWSDSAEKMEIIKYATGDIDMKPYTKMYNDLPNRIDKK